MAIRKQVFDEHEEGFPMKRSRLTIDVSPELHQRVKILAIKNHLTISEYLKRIIEQAIPDDVDTGQQEEYPITPDFLEQVYRVRERIIRESKGQLFEDSAELVRQQREERTRYLEELREQP